MTKKSLIICGGLGSVSLLRKLPFIYQEPLKSLLNVSCLVDVHPSAVVKNPQSLENLLNAEEEKHLVSKIPEVVRKGLLDGIASGRLQYFQKDDIRGLYDFIRNCPSPLIDISTPNRTHCGVLKESISQSSASILLEKPSACDSEDLGDMDSYLSGCNGQLKGRILLNLDHYLYYENIRQYLDNLQEYISGEIMPNNVRLGKIKGVRLKLEETEGFDKQRNRDIINIKKSGGGVSLDLAVHCMQFLGGLGARVIFPPEKVECGKVDDPSISGEEYGETEFHAKFFVNGGQFTEQTPVSVYVGKAKAQKKKNFYVFHENGSVDLSMDRREMVIYGLPGNILFAGKYLKDPFQNAYEHIVHCVDHPSTEIKTPLSRSITVLQDLFELRTYANKPNSVPASRNLP